MMALSMLVTVSKTHSPATVRMIETQASITAPVALPLFDFCGRCDALYPVRTPKRGRVFAFSVNRSTLSFSTAHVENGRSHARTTTMPPAAFGFLLKITDFFPMPDQGTVVVGIIAAGSVAVEDTLTVHT